MRPLRGPACAGRASPRLSPVREPGQRRRRRRLDLLYGQIRPHSTYAATTYAARSRAPAHVCWDTRDACWVHRVLLPGCQCRRSAVPVKGAQDPLLPPPQQAANPAGRRDPAGSKHLGVPASRGKPLTSPSARSCWRLPGEGHGKSRAGLASAEGARGMNETTLTMAGNLVADPELRYTPTGAAVVSLRIASTERFKGKGGWQDGDTLFMIVTAWRALAENVAESASKGTRVIVTGRLKQRS